MGPVSFPRYSNLISRSVTERETNHQCGFSWSISSRDTTQALPPSWGMLKPHTVLFKLHKFSSLTHKQPQEKKAKHYFLWGFKVQKQKHCYKPMHVLGRELIQSSGLLKKSCCSAVGGISISRGSFFGHTVSELQFSALAGAIGESTKRQQLFNKSRFYKSSMQQFTNKYLH